MATTKGKTKSKTSRAPSKAQLQKQRKKQFYAIILFAVGLFLVAVSLIDGPAAWGFLHDCLRGIFGPICYAVGPLIVGAAVIITVDKEHVEVRHKVWQTAVLIVLLCGFSQIFYGLPEGNGFWGQFSSLYLDGVLLKSGGVLAAILGWPLLRYCGTAGAAIILLLAAFVFLMLITGSTLMGFFKTCAKPVKHMEESYVQFKEQREETEIPVQHRRSPGRGPAHAGASCIPRLMRCLRTKPRFLTKWWWIHGREKSSTKSSKTALLTTRRTSTLIFSR